MDLARIEPYSALRDMERIFERRAAAWVPRMDVLDLEDRLVIRLEVAGIPAGDIDITVEDRTVSISGARAFDTEGRHHHREILTGRFTRSVVVPDGLDTDAISAATRDGLLEVSIPRRPEVLPRKVKVEFTSS